MASSKKWGLLKARRLRYLLGFAQKCVSLSFFRLTKQAESESWSWIKFEGKPSSFYLFGTFCDSTFGDGEAN